MANFGENRQKKQHQPLTMRRNFSWTLVGNVVYAACQWGMLVVLAKVGSPEMVGQFTLGLAVTAPVFMLANLQLRDVQATDTRQQYVFSDYLGLRLLTTGLSLPVIAGITQVAGYRWETSAIILVIGLAKAVESISDLFYGLFQQQEQMNLSAVSMMLRGSSSLLLLGSGVYLTGSLFWGTVGLTFAWIIVLLSYDIRSGALLLNAIAPVPLRKVNGDLELARLLQPRWHLQTITKLIWLALPLGLVMMLGALNTNIPRYFIEQYLGERELGVFAAIAYLMTAGNIVVLALGKAAIPRLAQYYAAKNSAAFRTLLLKLVGIGVLLGGASVLVAIGAGREILSLLYQPEYAAHTDIFVWLMIAAGIGYVCCFFSGGMTAARYFRIQIPLFVIVTATSATFCLWLIPTMGMQGAAIALIVGAIVQVAISLVIIFHALRRLHKSQERI